MKSLLDKLCIHTVLPVFLVLMGTTGIAKDYIIYSIGQEVSLGNKDEKIRKNYYINMGQKQGLRNGTVLEVYRKLSRMDPYDRNNQYHYKVKVGKISIIHSETSASIANQIKFDNNLDSPLTEINSFMIGDIVNISVKK
jgi:hypothetical protein